MPLIQIQGRASLAGLLEQLQGKGWHQGQVRQILLDKIRATSGVPKMPAIVYAGPTVGAVWKSHISCLDPTLCI